MISESYFVNICFWDKPATEAQDWNFHWHCTAVSDKNLKDGEMWRPVSFQFSSGRTRWKSLNFLAREVVN